MPNVRTVANICKALQRCHLVTAKFVYSKMRCEQWDCNSHCPFFGLRSTPPGRHYCSSAGHGKTFFAQRVSNVEALTVRLLLSCSFESKHSAEGVGSRQACNHYKKRRNSTFPILATSIFSAVGFLAGGELDEHPCRTFAIFFGDLSRSTPSVEVTWYASNLKHCPGIWNFSKACIFCCTRHRMSWKLGSHIWF